MAIGRDRATSRQFAASGSLPCSSTRDTYEAASRVHDLLVKTHPADREKIELTRKLISEHLDIDHILSRFADPGDVSPRQHGKLDPLPVRTIRSLGTEIPRLPGMRDAYWIASRGWQSIRRAEGNLTARLARAGRSTTVSSSSVSASAIET